MLLESYDFMRLGQAILNRNWNTAMMIISGMQRAAEAEGLTDTFGSNFSSIRQCIIAQDLMQAQDILAVVTAKRVKLLNDKKKEEERM